MNRASLVVTAVRVIAAVTLVISWSGTLSSSMAIEEKPVDSLEYGILKTGSRAYTFLAKTRISLEPTSSSASMEEGAPGTSLFVIEKASATQTVNGFEDYWYKVRTTKGQIGYVWGGNLSKSWREVNPGGGLVVLSIEGKGPDTNEKLAKAILIKAGKVLSQTQFPPVDLPESKAYGYCISSSGWKSDDFKGKPFIATFSFHYGACDYPFGDILIGVVANRVNHLLTTTNSGNDEGGSTSTLIWPGDKGGKPEKLIVEDVSENLSEKRRLKTTRVYRWQSDHFELISK